MMQLGSWRFWILALLASSLIFEFHGRNFIQQKWNIQKAQQEQKIKDAFQQLRAENAALAARQTLINDKIQKAHDEEIRTINTALANSERLRLGSKFCADGAGKANPESTSGRNEADTTGRLLSAEMDRAVRQLILESEQVAATGRAAQIFIRQNYLSAEK